MGARGALIFRPGIGASLAGFMFAAGAGFYAVSLAMGSLDHDLGRSATGSPRGLIVPLALLSLFFLAGLALIVYSRLCRVVVGEERLQAFDMFNRRKLDVTWSEIERYERTGPSQSLARNLNRQVTAHDRATVLPTVEKYAQLQLGLLSRLPEAAVYHPTLSGRLSEDPPQSVSGNLRNRHDGFLAVASIAGLVLLAGMAIAFAQPASQGENRASPADLVVIATLAAAFCAGFYPACLQSWRHLLRGWIEADGNGLRFDDGTGPVEILWADLRLVEVTRTSLNETEADQLVLVGRDQAIEIDERFRQFGDVKRMAIAYAPESAVVLPSRDYS